MPIKPGELTRRITLYERTKKLDAAGTGQDVGEWKPVQRDANPWAKVTPVSGDETADAQQVVARRVVDVVIWWREDLAQRGVEMRVVYENLSFDVVDVAEIGFREGLKLRAVARAER